MKNYNKLEDLLKNKNLTREQKVQAINSYFNNYRASIDKELNDYILKQRVGTALEIESAAIPMGGASTIGRKIGAKALEKTVGKALTKDIANKGIGAALGKNTLQKYLGNKISEEIGSGAFAGLNSSAVFGAGRGLIEGENPLKSAIEDASIGFLSGSIGGAVFGNLQKINKGKILENSNNTNKLNLKEIKKLRNQGKEYYKDYLQGREIFSPELGSSINFPGSQAGEIKPHNAKILPTLTEQLTNASKIRYSNDKPERLDAISFKKLYNTYKGKSYEYIIRNNSNQTGNDFYQVKEVGSNPAYSHQNRALGLEPNNMINDIKQNFNPAQVAIPGIIPTGMSQINSTDQQPYKLRIEKTIWDTIPMADPLKTPNNHIFTPEEIGQMSNEEFKKNEALIMQQAKDGLIKPKIQQQNFTGYKNPETGSSQIFTREDINSMSNDEFSQNEKAIMSQVNSIGIPTNRQLQDIGTNGGGVIYVKPYKRSDGTEVKGYYRSL